LTDFNKTETCYIDTETGLRVTFLNAKFVDTQNSSKATIGVGFKETKKFGDYFSASGQAVGCINMNVTRRGVNHGNIQEKARNNIIQPLINKKINNSETEKE